MMATCGEHPVERPPSVKSAQMGLAHFGVVAFVKRLAHGTREFPVRISLQLKSRADFSNVMRGGESDCTGWGEVVAGRREHFPHRLRHRADDEAVVAHGQRRPPGGGIGLGPTVGEFEGKRWHLAR